jgi:hypothetical protein
VPSIDTSAKSVEEISALIIQTLSRRASGSTANPSRTRNSGGRP